MKVLIADLKAKKNSNDDMKENMRLTGLYKQPETKTTTKKKTQKISNSLYWERCGCQN